MKKTRRKIDAALRAKIALEALREQSTIADLAQRYQVHPNQIYVLEEAADRTGITGIRPECKPGVEERTQRTIEDLYAKIGQLTVERVLCPRGPDDEQAGPGSQARPRPQGFVDTAQCPLLSLSRSGGVPLMRRLDELNTAPPFLGSRRMIAMLRAEELRILPTPYWRRRAAVPGRVRDFGWPT